MKLIGHMGHEQGFKPPHGYGIFDVQMEYGFSYNSLDSKDWYQYLSNRYGREKRPSALGEIF